MGNIIESESESKYVPGVCNLGKEEISRRRNGLYLSLTLLIINILILQLFHASNIWRLTSFLTVSYVAISYQQWYFKFCVKFGMKGVFNFGKLGKTFEVLQNEDKRKDRIKAIRMIAIGIVIGVSVAMIYYYL